MEKDHLEKPEDLSPLGEQAHQIIVNFLRDHDLTHTGGCKAFYSPAEWKARGEKYGVTSELVVVHDGGDHAAAFAYEHECYKTIDEMLTALRPAGLYVEQCTGWYSAVYKI